MRDHLCQNDPLAELIQKRINELEKQIHKHHRNGSHATIRHYEKQRNKNIELLFQLKRDRNFTEMREEA